MSVSKLTVAWKRLPCFRMSSVSRTSGLSRFSWMRYKARSKFSQKLISCKAVPEAGSRSSLVTFKHKITLKGIHIETKVEKVSFRKRMHCNLMSGFQVHFLPVNDKLLNLRSQVGKRSDEGSG